MGAVAALSVLGACGSDAESALSVEISAVIPPIVEVGLEGGQFVAEVEVRVNATSAEESPGAWLELDCLLTEPSPPEVTPSFPGCPITTFSGEEVDETQVVPVTLDVLPGTAVGTYTVNMSATLCAILIDPSPGQQTICDVADADIIVRVAAPAASSVPTTVPATTAPPVAPAVTTAPPAPPAPPPAAPTTPAPAPATTVPATAAPQPTVTANLVADPSFDVQPAIGLLPATAGVWTGDQNAVVGAGAVAPHSGASMVQFLATGDVPSDRTETGQLWQVVDLAAYATQIDAGGVVADGGSWFHRVVGGPTTDRRFDLRLHAFDGAVSDLPARYAANNPLALQAVSITTDGSAWTNAAASLALPAGTRYVLVEIYAYEDVVNDGVTPEFEGHYADDVSLTLTLP